MRKSVLSLALLVVTCVLPGMPAQAQTRVFVAAQGSDSNPCTFAAPCRTFQHAHDTVAANGEIDVLDPAGYGALSITKSISIQGHGYAGVAVVAGNAVTISGSASDAVNISGLIIDGVGVGATGILFNSGGGLTVDNSLVRNFTSHAIVLQPSISTNVAFSDVRVSKNGGHGILLSPSGSANVNAAFNRVEVANGAGDGIFVNAGTSTGTIAVAVSDSIAANNTSDGFRVQSTSAASTFSLVRSVSANNGVGFSASGANATFRIAQSMVTGNTSSFHQVNSGTVTSYGDNYISDNGAPLGALGSSTKQ
jgi:hypothetical protein